MNIICRKCSGFQITNVRIWIRCCLCALVLCINGFLLQTYTAWGMWDRRYYQRYDHCTEKYINYETRGKGDVFSDVDLHAACEMNATKRNRQNHHKYIDGNNTPNIDTICSSVQPSLLSRIRKVVRQEEDGLMLVPNIVHYVSFNKYEWTFLNYLSLLSVDRFIKPHNIFIHGDTLPFGYWWRRTLEDVSNIYHVWRVRPDRIQGKIIPWIEHSSDIIRIQTILQNGGIYLDTDILVVKSFDPLRKHTTTLGRETFYGLGSGIIIAEAFSKFMCVWVQAYRHYNPWPWHWALYAVWTPNRLSKILPSDIHIEEGTLHSPTWQEADKLFEQNIDWSDRYSVHVWHRHGHVPTRPDGPDGIAKLNSTLGEIMRFILYGNKKLR